MGHREGQGGQKEVYGTTRTTTAFVAGQQNVELAQPRKKKTRAKGVSVTNNKKARAGGLPGKEA